MHIYQRSVEGFNIFYGIEDYLVFFMIFSVVARLYKVTILELCIMINHIHVLLASEKLKEVSDFIMHYTSLFAKCQGNYSKFSEINRLIPFPLL